jgi:hypothetical protein
MEAMHKTLPAGTGGGPDDSAAPGCQFGYAWASACQHTIAPIRPGQRLSCG